jgi:formate hydrogenlyase subunit 3/multisubunit Na+/H+ antiporter MnhD subunit
MSFVLPPQPLLTYLYGCIYVFSFLFLFMLDRPLYVWVSIEVIIVFLVAMVLISSAYKSFLTSFIQYFVLQTFASFILLFCIVCPSSSSLIMCYFCTCIFYVALIIKLALFPFFWWYTTILIIMPFWILFFIMVPQKLPIPLLFFFLVTEHPSISYFLSYFTLFLSCRIFLSSVLSISSNDLRSSLIMSSLGSSCWISLSILAGFYVFFIYYITYLVIMVLLLVSLTVSNNHAKFTPHYRASSSLYLSSSWSYFIRCFSWLNLSGLPPFPVFFSKLLVVFSILSAFSIYISSVVVFIFLFASFIYLFIYARVLFSILLI